MKSWKEFSKEEPELANIGKRMLLQTSQHVGLGFLATLRKDIAPRMHPLSLDFINNHPYEIITAKSSWGGDLNHLKISNFCLNCLV